LDLETFKTMYPDMFPNLKPGRYEIIADADPGYNCVAKTVGLTDRWYWPGYSEREFDAFYARHGFKPLGDADALALVVEAGVEKVVIYRNSRGASPTHAARQLPGGRWLSKMGTLEEIIHQHPDDVSGPDYGRPARVYIKGRNKPQQMRFNFFGT